MEVFQAEGEDSKGVLKGGEFEGKRIGFEVAVKDKNRPGGGVPWAYYAFDLMRSPNRADPRGPSPTPPVISAT